MMTREQAENIRKHCANNDAITLCSGTALELAELWLAVQPRPLSEIDGGAIVTALNEMDEPAYHILFKYPNGSWLSHGMGKPWPKTTLAIPLSSLPKVQP